MADYAFVKEKYEVINEIVTHFPELEWEIRVVGKDTYQLEAPVLGQVCKVLCEVERDPEDREEEADSVRCWMAPGSSIAAAQPSPAPIVNEWLEKVVQQNRHIIEFLYRSLPGGSS